MKRLSLVDWFIIVFLILFVIGLLVWSYLGGEA
jgi:hypothetical protein